MGLASAKTVTLCFHRNLRKVSVSKRNLQNEKVKKIFILNVSHGYKILQVFSLVFL